MAKRSVAVLLTLEQDMPALRLGMAPNAVNWCVLVLIVSDCGE